MGLNGWFPAFGTSCLPKLTFAHKLVCKTTLRFTFSPRRALTNPRAEFAVAFQAR